MAVIGILRCGYSYFVFRPRNGKMNGREGEGKGKEIVSEQKKEVFIYI